MATGRVPTTANSPLTAKGDLFTYSTTQARLAVGSNGDTLVADSSTSTGLRYNPPVGSLANPVINGGFDIWQRGTSVAVSGAGALTFAADRWGYFRGSFATGMTVSRQATGDTTNLPNIQYAARVQRDSGNTSTSIIYILQNFETVNSIPFAGKTVTFSFYARAGANYSSASSILRTAISTGTGTDQNVLFGFTGNATPISGSATLTTTWQRFAYTGTFNSNITQIAVGFDYTPVGTAGANDWFEVTGVQIDVGTWTASTAPTFRRSGATLGGELAACQRYYYRQTATSSAFAHFGMGIGFSTTVGVIDVRLPVTMRVEPTSVDFGNLRLEDTSNAQAVTGLTLNTNHSNESIATVDATVASGLTQYRPYYLGGNNNVAAYLGFSAEL